MTDRISIKNELKRFAARNFNLKNYELSLYGFLVSNAGNFKYSAKLETIQKATGRTENKTFEILETLKKSGLIFFSRSENLIQIEIKELDSIALSR